MADMVRDDGADGDAARLLVARGAPVYKPSQAAGLGLRERLAQLLDECPDDSRAVSTRSGTLAQAADSAEPCRVMAPGHGL